jgi:hypothetical protein
MDTSLNSESNSEVDTNHMPDLTSSVSWSFSVPTVPKKTILNPLEKIVSNMTFENRTDPGTANSVVLTEPPESYYEILGLQRLATNQDIEAAFLKKVRKLLRSAPNCEIGLSRTLKRQLATLYVTRDILLDSRCRDDHDFRLLSLRLGKQRTSRNHIKRQGLSKNTNAEIVEALIFAESLEPTKVTIVLEKYKASDKTKPFAEFLVQNQMIGPEELESALLGRELVNRGLAGRGALKWAFNARHFFGVDFVDSLLGTIDITLDDLMKLSKQLDLKIIAAKIASKSQKNETCSAAII